jgi:predicted branched-subunit amino acid permease
MAPAVAMGFLFVNIIFIACLLANSRAAPIIASIIIGAIAGPVCHLISPSNGILIAGIIAGTAGHFMFRGHRGSPS